jgi:hypothetical protein
MLCFPQKTGQLALEPQLVVQHGKELILHLHNWNLASTEEFVLNILASKICSEAYILAELFSYQDFTPVTTILEIPSSNNTSVPFTLYMKVVVFTNLSMFILDELAMVSMNHHGQKTQKMQKMQKYIYCHHVQLLFL